MKWKLSKSLVISSGNEVTGIEMEEVFNYHRIYIMCVCQSCALTIQQEWKSVNQSLSVSIFTKLQHTEFEPK